MFEALSRFASLIIPSKRNNIYNKSNINSNYKAIDSAQNSPNSTEASNSPQGSFDLIQNSPPTKVRVLTYNIFLRPPAINTNLDDYKNARVEEFIKSMKEYDIVCLQEAFGFWNNRKQMLIKLAQKQGYVSFAESPNPSIFSSYVIDGGLLIFSRYKIVKSEFHAYPYSVQADSVAMKGVLYAKVGLADNHIHVFTTHTQATHGNAFDIDTYITRGDQLLAFRKFLDQIIAREYVEGDIVILCGDFNVNSRSPYFYIEDIEADYTPLKLYKLPKFEGFCNEYTSMATILSKNNEDTLIDILYKSHDAFPPTYGVSRLDPDGWEQPDETVLTHAGDHCTNLCLDYMFQLIPNKKNKVVIPMNEEGDPKKSSKLQLQINQDGSKVEKFYVQHPKVSQLSDHFGLSTTVEVAPL